MNNEKIFKTLLLFSYLNNLILIKYKILNLTIIKK